MKGAIVIGAIVGFLFQWAHANAFAGDATSVAIAYEASNYFQNGSKSFLGELQEFASSSRLGAEIYFPFGLGENASDLADNPFARLGINIVWSIGGLIVLWFVGRLISLKIVGPMIYRKLNGEYDAQYSSYLESADEPEIGEKEHKPAQPGPSQGAVRGGFAANQRGGFGRL